MTTPLDPQALWQEQPARTRAPALDEVKTRMKRLDTRLSRRNLRELAAGALVVVLFAARALAGDRPLERLGSALVVLGTLWVCWTLWSQGRSRQPDAEGLGSECVHFYAQELRRQRALLERVWRWYLGPLVPGMAVLVADSVAKDAASPSPRGWPVNLEALVVGGVFLSVAQLNRAAARKLTAELVTVSSAEEEHAPLPEATLRAWDVALSLLALAVVALASMVGAGTNVINFAVLLALPIGLVARGWWAYRGELMGRWLRHPFARAHRPYLLQALLRWAFLAVWAGVLKVSIIPLQLGEAHLPLVRLLAAAMLGTALLQLLPSRRILWARNALLVLLTLWFGGQLLRASATPEPSLLLDSPFQGEALVFQGGRSAVENHHVHLSSQRDAVDLVPLRDGKLVEGFASSLTAHSCFDAPLHAPAAGRVVTVVNDQPDLPVGKMDSESPLGNHVVLELAPEQFLLLAHLAQGSVRVRPGEQVACGQVIARCGNSGNTSEPHLHLQVQSRPDFRAPDLNTFPFHFRNVSSTTTAPGVPLYPKRNVRFSPSASACGKKPE